MSQTSASNLYRNLPCSFKNKYYRCRNNSYYYNNMGETFCKSHRQKDTSCLIPVKDNNLTSIPTACFSENCNENNLIYGYAGNPPDRCSNHKLLGITNLKDKHINIIEDPLKKCEVNGCTLYALFGNTAQRFRCNVHRRDIDIISYDNCDNLCKAKCNSCDQYKHLPFVNSSFIKYKTYLSLTKNKSIYKSKIMDIIHLELNNYDYLINQSAYWIEDGNYIFDLCVNTINRDYIINFDIDELFDENQRIRCESYINAAIKPTTIIYLAIKKGTDKIREKKIIDAVKCLKGYLNNDSLNSLVTNDKVVKLFYTSYDILENTNFVVREYKLCTFAECRNIAYYFKDDGTNYCYSHKTVDSFDELKVRCRNKKCKKMATKGVNNSLLFCDEHYDSL